MANGKAIGNKGEREICDMLSKWCGGSPKEKIFWRCPNSGAIGTILEDNGTLCGDIIAIKKEGAFLTSKFAIEVKRNYPNSSFNKFMSNNKNDDIYNFWKQTCEAATKAEKEPMLFYTKTRHNTLLGIPYKLVSKIKNGLESKKRLTIHFESDIFTPCTFFDAKEFFSIVNPDDIKEL